MRIDVTRLSPTAQKQLLGKVLAEQESKYHNRKAVRMMPNGTQRTFDSQKEARRYDELAALLRAGKIRDLRLQPTFTLQESYVTAEGETMRAITYKADFSYLVPVTEGAGTRLERVIEDAKGDRTEVYKLKRKMMAERGWTVREI